jgi:hypothetical protein
MLEIPGAGFHFNRQAIHLPTFRPVDECGDFVPYDIPYLLCPVVTGSTRAFI